MSSPIRLFIFGSEISSSGDCEKILKTRICPKKIKCGGYTKIKENSENLCAICLNNYGKGEFRRTLKCQHFFHKKCIDPWIKISDFCPVCRQSI